MYLDLHPSADVPGYAEIKDLTTVIPPNFFLSCYVSLQDGVNWLAFLNKYKLHGILCDDMGLGKTLQSLCILAGDHQIRADKYQVMQHSIIVQVN